MWSITWIPRLNYSLSSIYTLPEGTHEKCILLVNTVCASTPFLPSDLALAVDSGGALSPVPSLKIPVCPILLDIVNASLCRLMYNI